MRRSSGEICLPWQEERTRPAGSNETKPSPLRSLRDMEVSSQEPDAGMADVYALSKRLTSSSEVVRLGRPTEPGDRGAADI